MASRIDESFSKAIGHAKIDTTSQYVENLSEKERQTRMLEISVDKVKSEGYFIQGGIKSKMGRF